MGAEPGLDRARRLGVCRSLVAKTGFAHERHRRYGHDAASGALQCERLVFGERWFVCHDPNAAVASECAGAAHSRR